MSWTPSDCSLEASEQWGTLGAVGSPSLLLSALCVGTAGLPWYEYVTQARLIGHRGERQMLE